MKSFYKLSLAAVLVFSMFAASSATVLGSGKSSAVAATITKFNIPGTSVTASTDDGNVPANTVDGSLTTRWSGSGDGQWINYDIGSTQSVGSIKIAFYKGTDRT